MTTEPRLTRRQAVALGGSLALAGGLPRFALPGVARAAAVPTFEQVTGFPAGSVQASAEQLDTYVERVAAASARVETDELPGRTVQGRPCATRSCRIRRTSRGSTRSSGACVGFGCGRPLRPRPRARPQSFPRS